MEYSQLSLKVNENNDITGSKLLNSVNENA